MYIKIKFLSKYLFYISSIIFFLISCQKTIPEYGCSKYGCTSTGGRSNTLLIIPTENNSNMIKKIKITFESLDTSNKGTCSVYRKCQNMTYDFMLKNDFEVVKGLREGEYVVKKVEHFETNKDKINKTINLNKKFNIKNQDMHIVDFGIIFDQEILLTKINNNELVDISSKIKSFKNSNQWNINYENKNSFQIQEGKDLISNNNIKCIILDSSKIGSFKNNNLTILHNILEYEVGKYCSIVSNERLNLAIDEAFETMNYNECTEDQCIMIIQEMLQVENVFQMILIEEEDTIQLNIKLRTLDESFTENYMCNQCKVHKLRAKIISIIQNFSMKIN